MAKNQNRNRNSPWLRGVKIHRLDPLWPLRELPLITTRKQNETEISAKSKRREPARTIHRRRGDRDPVRSGGRTLISNLSGCSKHRQETTLVRSLRVRRELDSRETGARIGDSGAGRVRSAYHGGDGEDGAGSSRATGLNPRDPQRRRVWCGAARRERIRSRAAERSEERGMEKTEKLLTDEGGFVCNLISLIQNSNWKLLCLPSGIFFVNLEFYNLRYTLSF